MFFYLAIACLAFLLIRILVVIANLLTKPYLPLKTNYTGQAKTVVLIPARNEAKNIKNTLQLLVSSAPKNAKILVLDDHSTDETASIITQMTVQYPQIQLLQGRDLPSDWLGKNWACHQLAQAAQTYKPDYLCFIDADVMPQPYLFESAVAEMEAKKLSLLSLFPDQKMETWGEKIVVPIMHFLLLTLLPLRLVYAAKYSSLAAANGQFMFFDAQSYFKNQWHAAVKTQVTEDIEIVKSIKEKGEKAETLLPKGLIMCRMYHNWNEAINGFSKNLLAGFGNQIAFLVTYIILTMFAYYAVFITFGIIGLFSSLLLLTIMILCVAKLSQQSFWETLCLHCLRSISFLVIAMKSIYRNVTKTNTWKGRKI